MKEYLTHTADETRARGKEFAKTLTPGTVVLLEGELGSGKTTFLQGVVAGFGSSDVVTSPSFTIMHEYTLPHGTLIRHLDLYRLDDPRVDADRIGFAEILNDPTAITFIEWAEKLPKEYLFSSSRRIRFAHGDTENLRRIEDLS